MQLIQSGYYRSLSEKNRIRVVRLEAPRGKILDRKGRILATSRLSFNLSVTPQVAKAKIRRSLEILSPILGESPEDLWARYKKKKPGIFHTIMLSDDLPAEKAIAAEEVLNQLPGFLIETRPLRQYPHGESTAHLVGYLGPTTSQEEEEFEYFDYAASDWLGREGVERSYESYLRGVSGGVQMEVNSRGQFVKTLAIKEPKEGKDIRLSIDAELLDHVHGLLEGQKGAVIVMNLEDGGLLALNSAPSFDPNLFITSRGRKEVGRFLVGSGSPMLNRSVRGRYPPGSIFKIVTAMAALEQKKIRRESIFYCGGGLMVGERRFPCWYADGHGPQSMAEAFAHSCNVFFYNSGLRAGADAIANYAARLGYDHLTGVDLPGEKQGFVPTPAWKRKVLKMPWFDGETANFAIGQGYLQVTPIQALVMIAMIANNGQIAKPHVVDEIDGVKIYEKPPFGGIRLDQDDLNAVKEGLDAVVNSPTGTGRLAKISSGARIAGKTGTAQSGQYKTHAWFVGYAPAAKPKVALVVFLEHGGRGGVSAARVASSVFEWLAGHQYL